MDIIRLATPEEISEISTESDLGPGSAVLAYGKDRVVMKNVVEIDPIFCDNARRKALLVSHLETYLRLTGVPQYYFNLSPSDEEYRNLCIAWGAQQISKEPELRFKKVL